MRITFYVDRVPGKPLKGRGWIDIRDLEVVKRLNIPYLGNCTNSQVQIKIDKESPEYKVFKQQGYSHSKSNGISVGKIEEDYLIVIVSCSRGKAGGKKFQVIDKRENVGLIVQKSLTIEAVRFWTETWASKGAYLVTPGGKKIAIEQNKVRETEYVYLIYSEANNAIKIGRAKNVEERLQALQTAHPYPLKILKILEVSGKKAAIDLEKQLHQQFAEYRLLGEWFKASEALMNFSQEQNN